MDSSCYRIRSIYYNCRFVPRIKSTQQYCKFVPCCSFSLSANHVSSWVTHFRAHSFLSQVFRLGLPREFLLCVCNSLLLSATRLIHSTRMFLLYFSICIFDRSLSIMSAFIPLVARFTLFVMPFVLRSVKSLNNAFYYCFHLHFIKSLNLSIKST